MAFQWFCQFVLKFEDECWCLTAWQNYAGKTETRALNPNAIFVRT